MISILMPIYVKNKEQIDMTFKSICLAKQHCDLDNVEWVIVETESDYFIDEADVYIKENKKTTPTKSINRGFNNCSGDRIVYLSNDVYVGDKWLSSLNDCFNIEDCGLSTLASTELGQCKEDFIEEGVYFPICMINRKYAQFDEAYNYLWNDTDVIMRVYIDGLKMYRNHNSIVDHLKNKTLGDIPVSSDIYQRDKNIFINKFGKYSEHRMYKILTEGTFI